MNEPQTTLGAVAESQQNLNNVTEQVTQPAQTTEQQNAEASNSNWTWTSSWAESTEQVEQSQTSTDAEQKPEQPEQTLEQVIQEDETAKTQKENEAALQELIKEQTKDLPSDSSTDVNVDAVSSVDESNRLDDEIKQGLDDIKDKKTAEEMAKKVYLAFQKERSIHEFDNEQNKNTIEVLKWMVKKLNEQITSNDNDPRNVKLDDEFYTLRRLEQAHQKSNNTESKNNLTRFYATKLAVLNPSVNVNKIMDVLQWAPLKSNTMWETAPTSAWIAQVKKPATPHVGLPQSKRGMF